MKDNIAVAVYRNIVHDLKNRFNIKIGQEQMSALDKGFSAFRDVPPIECDESAPDKYRPWISQLNGLFKKYIADSDVHTQEDLNAAAIKQFVETQGEVNAQTSTSTKGHMMYREIRRIMTIFLGKKVPLDLFEQGNFTEKASRLVSRRQGHLHHKVSKASCTEQQKSFFNSIFGKAFGDVNFTIVNTLVVIAVEKTFEKARTITPDSVIHGMLSNAIGKWLQTRLLGVGIDITRQQEVHKRLVTKTSKTGQYATLDLSKASDMFSIPFMRRVLPSAWYRLLSMLRFRKYETPDGKQTVASSFMAMGIGYTFPLQTMLFYAIIQSVRNLLREHDGIYFPGVISVYGDDCIFPAGYAPYVLDVMAELGFIVNTDKTFTSGKFYESCGNDRYNGIDVRPVFFTWDSDVTPLENLYKFYNKIFSRYHECELPTLKKYLLSEIATRTAKIHIVPMDYPDTSGIRVRTLAMDLETYFGSLVFHKPKYYPQLDLSNIDLDGPIDVEQIEMGWYFCCVVPPKIKYEVVPKHEHWLYLQYALYRANQRKARYFDDFVLREQLHMFSRPVTANYSTPEVVETKWTKFRFRGKKYAEQKKKLRRIVKDRVSVRSILDAASYGLQVPKKGKQQHSDTAHQAVMSAGL